MSGVLTPEKFEEAIIRAKSAKALLAPVGTPLSYFMSEWERQKHNFSGGKYMTHLAWHFPPKKELLERLNARLRGIDPGEPQNWKGL